MARPYRKRDAAPICTPLHAEPSKTPTSRVSNRSKLIRILVSGFG
jgi:hypothetical protein